MNRIVLIALALIAATALFALKGCGQPEEATVTTPAASTAAPTEAAPAQDNQTETAAAIDPAAERIQMAQVDLSSVEAAGYIEGRHYTLISPAQPTNTPPGQVEVNEFFMHSCIHCYNLEPFIEAWLQTKPDFINFVRVPTTWDEVRILHAQAYYAAESLDVVDEIMMPFFREFHDVGNYLETPAKLTSFFGRFGVSAEEFENHFSSFSVITKVNNAAQLGQRYRIDSTPQLVVNGKYRLGVDSAGGTDQLFELIELLAAAERGQ